MDKTSSRRPLLSANRTVVRSTAGLANRENEVPINFQPIISLDSNVATVRSLVSETAVNDNNNYIISLCFVLCFWRGNEVGVSDAQILLN